MQNWEYQVVRLNVEPSVAEEPDSKQPPSEQLSNKGMEAQEIFSKAYLKEEFPTFYASPEEATHPASTEAQKADAALQLQTYLNSQGQQGWDLVGFQHAGPHVFIIFKRSSPGEHAQLASQAAQSEQLRMTLELASRALAIIEKQSGRGSV